MLEAKSIEDHMQILSMVQEHLRIDDVCPFRLSEEFLSKYKGKQPKWKNELSYFVYKRTYARMVYATNEDGRQILYKTDIHGNKIYYVMYKDHVKLYDRKGEDFEYTGDMDLFTFGTMIDKDGRRFMERKGDPIPLGRTEEFWETLKRVVEGEFTILKTRCLGGDRKFPWNEEEAQRKAQRTYELMWNFKFLPPGRGLWMMGTDFVRTRGSMALNNCGFVSTENIDIDGSKPFRWFMDALMLGVGVGSDVRGAGKVIIKKPIFTDEIFTIPDSREGWVEAVGKVIDGYFKGTEIPRFDYSKIRKKGEPIRGFGGIASGPQPLIELIDNLHKILGECIGKPIRGKDLVDIFTNIGKAVVAGNVRRSAEIMLGFIDDDEFIKLKENYWVDEPPHRQARWASNNSIIARKGDDYSKIVPYIVKNGEPGILWLENAQIFGRMISKPDYADVNAKGVNPCGEQTLESWELCTLVETFPSHHDSYEEFKETLKYAYLYAKAVTLSYVKDPRWSETNGVMSGNRRIGISQSGIIDAFKKHGREEMLRWCDEGYKYLRKLDKEYSRNWLRVRESIKLTTVKPSGTVSLLAGVSPGIHYPHSEYYIRRIRVASNSELIPYLLKANYELIPDAKFWKRYPKYHPKEGQPMLADEPYDLVIFEGTEADPERGIKKREPVVIKTRYLIREDKHGKPVDVNTVVVEFPIHTEYFDRGKRDVSMWEQLQNAADYQRWWSDNQVSITVTFTKRPDDKIRKEIEDLKNEIEDIKRKLTEHLDEETRAYLESKIEKLEEKIREDEIKLKISKNTKYESDQIEDALRAFEGRLKSVSFLPLDDHGYDLAPYEEITEEEYHRRKAKLKPLVFDGNYSTAGIGERGCSSDMCELKNEIKEFIEEDKTDKDEDTSRVVNIKLDL